MRRYGFCRNNSKSLHTLWCILKSYFQRLVGCLYTFQKRFESPIWNLPMFFGGWNRFQTTVRTVSAYCQAIQELKNCYGANFTENCIQKDQDESIYALLYYDYQITFTLLGNGMLCPNEENGLTYEELSCFATTTQYLNTNYYKCDNKQNTDETVSLIYPKDIMVCQLLVVDKECGRKMSTTLCKLFQSKYMNFVQASVLDGACESHLNEECKCFKMTEIW